MFEKLKKSTATSFGIPDYPWKDFFMLYCVFIFMIGVFYFLPFSFRYVTAIALLLIFSVSKKDYWWFALFFIVYSGPLGVFKEGLRDATTGIPLFSFGSGLSFSFTQLFLLIGLAKAIYYKRPFRSVFKNQFVILFGYFGILILISIFLGTSFGIIIDDLKKSIFWVFIFLFPALIRDRKETYYFILLFLPIVVIVFVDALFFLSSGGNYLGNLLHLRSINSSLNLGINSDSIFDARFMLPGWHAVLIGFIVSLAFAQINKKHSLFLYTIAGMAFIIEIISATRSWFVIFAIIAGFTFYRGKKLQTTIIGVGVFILLFYFTVLFFSASNTAFSSAIDRIFTVFQTREEGTVSNQSIRNKLKYRLPQQLEYIKQNPITGWGFTEKRGDMDVGIFGHWVEVGLVGLAIFFWLWHSLLKYTWKLSKTILIPRPYRRLFAVFWIGFIGLLISHFTTNQIFGITYYTVVISMYFWLIDFFLCEAQNQFYLKINEAA